MLTDAREEWHEVLALTHTVAGEKMEYLDLIKDLLFKMSTPYQSQMSLTNYCERLSLISMPGRLPFPCLISRHMDSSLVGKDPI